MPPTSAENIFSLKTSFCMSQAHPTSNREGARNSGGGKAGIVCIHTFQVSTGDRWPGQALIAAYIIII